MKVIKVTLVIHKVNRSKHVQQKYPVETKFNFTCRGDKNVIKAEENCRLKWFLATLKGSDCRETKISVSLLDHNYGDMSLIKPNWSKVTIPPIL